MVKAIGSRRTSRGGTYVIVHGVHPSRAFSQTPSEGSGTWRTEPCGWWSTTKTTTSKKKKKKQAPRSLFAGCPEIMPEGVGARTGSWTTACPEPGGRAGSWTGPSRRTGPGRRRRRCRRERVWDEFKGRCWVERAPGPERMADDGALRTVFAGLRRGDEIESRGDFRVRAQHYLLRCRRRLSHRAPSGPSSAPRRRPGSCSLDLEATCSENNTFLQEVIQLSRAVFGNSRRGRPPRYRRV